MHSSLSRLTALYVIVKVDTFPPKLGSFARRGFLSLGRRLLLLSETQCDSEQLRMLPPRRVSPPRPLVPEQPATGHIPTGEKRCQEKTAACGGGGQLNRADEDICRAQDHNNWGMRKLAFAAAARRWRAALQSELNGGQCPLCGTHGQAVYSPKKSPAGPAGDFECRFNSIESKARREFVQPVQRRPEVLDRVRVRQPKKSLPEGSK